MTEPEKRQADLVEGIDWARAIVAVDGVDWDCPIQIDIDPLVAEMAPRPSSYEWAEPGSIQWGFGDHNIDSEEVWQSPCDQALDKVVLASSADGLFEAVLKALMSPGTLIDYLQVVNRATGRLGSIGDGPKRERTLSVLGAGIALIEANPDRISAAAERVYGERSVEQVQRPFLAAAQVLLSDGLVDEAARLEHRAEELLGQRTAVWGHAARETVTSLHEIAENRSK